MGAMGFISTLGTISTAGSSGASLQPAAEQQRNDVGPFVALDCIEENDETPVILFVKYHKVGGTSMAMLLAKIAEEQYPTTGIQLGETGQGKYSFWCGGGVCLDHSTKDSMRVFVDAVNATGLSPWSSCFGTHPTGECSLLSAKSRHSQLDGNLDARRAVSSPWLPCVWAPPSRKMLTIILLREPHERLRSKYFFQRDSSWCEDLWCRPKHEDFARWLEKPAAGESLNGTAYDQEACCEYTAAGGTLNRERTKEQAMIALAQDFDVIAIAERYLEAVVETLRQLGLSYGAVPCLPSARENEDKDEWTTHTLKLAKEATAEDARVYAFAVQLSQQRLLAAWGSQDNLDQQTQKYENECREIEWPNTDIGHDST